jgi:hypothetical protein
MPSLKTLGDARDAVASDDAGKHDHLVRVQELSLQHGRLFIPGADDDGFGFALSPWATLQACQRLGIPTAYFNRCPSDLKDAQFNHWRQQEEILRKTSSDDPEAASWLVRAKDATIRGVLSARYEKLDNRQVIEALLPALAGSRYQVRLMELTRESFHLRLVDPGICRDVLPGDKLLVGIHVANSEVGLRAVTVDAVVFRVVCENGLVRRIAGKSLLKQRHIHVADSARLVPLLEEAISQATLVAAAFIEQMALSIKTPVPDPDRAIAHLGQIWGLTRETQEFVKLALLGEPRHCQQETLYGLVNALTNAAQRLPVDDRFQLETLAAILIDVTGESGDQSLRGRILSGHALRG